ncbi:MAG TPA: trypsin-like peptidase domain-containing protein [Thermoanaerobaculia bacterium]|nr:trypsin-like peptidase domain-containing protein [Thermoanaerobaculia bacterium]
MSRATPGVRRLPTARRLLLLSLLVAAVPAATARGQLAGDPYHRGERAQDLVVWIAGADAAGAGVVFDYDGRYASVMTALHVIRAQGRYLDELKVEFRVWPGQALPVVPGTIRARENLDLAAFKVDLEPLLLSPAEIGRTLPLDLLGSSEVLRRGDPVHTVGHTLDYQWLIPNQPIFFHSFLSLVPGSGDGELAQIEYQCPRGHSGGALFDERWRLVGLILDTEGPFCRVLRVETALRVLRQFGFSVGLRRRAMDSEGWASTLPAEIQVAVVDFDNRSGAHLPDLGPAAHDVISSFLVSLPRVVVLTRDRVDTVMRELRLTGTEKGTGQITRAGKLLDTDVIVTGSVVRYDVERRTFKGFGTSALSDHYRMSISLLLIDVASGRIRFAETFDVEDRLSYPHARSAPYRPLSRESELLRRLLDREREKIQRSLMDVALGLETAGQMIAVPVATVPEGADVLIGGVWVGSTPAELELSLGVHEI